MNLTEVMYASIGKVIVMQSWKKPVTVERYDTLHSKEYQEYLLAGNKKFEREDLKKHFFPIRVRINQYILVPYDCEIDNIYRN